MGNCIDNVLVLSCPALSSVEYPPLSETMVGIPIAVGLMKTTAYVYDACTFPIQMAVQKPWKNWNSSKIWAKQTDPKDPYSPYVLIDPYPMDIPDDIVTLDQLFRYSVCKYRNRETFGTRELIGIEEETQGDGKVFRKFVLGKYKWMTMDDADEKVWRYARALLALGIRSRQKVCIFAETRIEWFLIAQACLRINVGVVTLFPNLGDEGLIHGIKEADVQILITSSELLPKVKSIIKSLDAITNMIYMEGLKTPDLREFPENIKIQSFTELENSIDDLDPEMEYDPPTPDDLAILMYTSGSTGVPKGVLITHKNFMATVRGFYAAVQPTTVGCEEIMYIGYLPLAHIFEIASEIVTLAVGSKVGYSSPLTLTDKSTGLAKGCKGDATLLRPTIMCAVPLMLDRIRKSITEVVESKGNFSKSFFNFALKYKDFWGKKGFDTPILNRIIFQKIRLLLGGRVNLIISGSAPLSPDTHNFIKMCLGVTLIQGYGMTETAASGTAMNYMDNTVGTVGPPLINTKIRLVDWEEGNYFVTDKPNPRGEVVIGGDCVNVGYYKNEELSKECANEENGVRWFYTGDIGEMLPNGCLKIIDRKKDLVKLQHGEYISLGKIESELKTCSLVDNICVFGNGLHTFVVALVVPNENQFLALGKQHGKDDLTFKELCQDREMTKTASKVIMNHATKCHLLRVEIPQKYYFCLEQWLPESGLVTAAFKVRRKIIQQHYQHVLDNLYDVRPSS